MAKNKSKKTDATAAGARRAAHFAAGNDLASWRGRPATFADRKARGNKRACRGKNFLD